LVFHPIRCTTISGDGQTRKGRKSYLVPLAAKGRFWSALPGFSVAVSADSFIGHPGNRSWTFAAALEPRPGRSEVRTLYDSFEIFGKEGTWTYIVARLSRLPESLRSIIPASFKIMRVRGI